MTIKTSEYVSLGHPDKVADYISEYILDKCLSKDKDIKYALEVQVKDNFISLAGEITTSASIEEKDYQNWAREAVNNIGYTKEYQNKWGKENAICGDEMDVVCHISQQSKDIAVGVVENQGWGDQGIFFGYAENNPETDYMSLDYYLAKSLNNHLYNNALNNNLGGLDIKTQISVEESNKELKMVIVAIPTLNEEEYEKIKEEVKNFFLERNFTNINSLFEKNLVIINGTGIYRKHGPLGDSGVTGRKLVVDFYGSASQIGGGAPWTKDSTKADLTLNLYARELAITSLKDYKNKDEVGCIRTRVSCCIGKEEILVSIVFYSKDKINILYETEYALKLKSVELIEKYHLNEPIFASLCKDGLFSKI